MLYDHIKRQIETDHDNAVATLDAHRERLLQAEGLAARLTSAGIATIAGGRMEAGHVLTWVTAGPVTLDRLDDTLTRLDLAEQDRTPGQTECEFRLQGIDVPLYVMLPLPERVLP